MIDKQSFNLEVYKSLRAEMDLRINNYYRLILAKYTFGGALLAYLITHRTQLTANISPFLIVSGFAFLLDVAILGNLGWMKMAGAFIKDHIETIDPDLIKWETIGAQPSDKWSCFTVPGYILGTWSNGAIFFIGAFGVHFRTIGRANELAQGACACLLVYTLYLTIKHLGRRVSIHKLRFP